ncbi:glucosaminidase domain-containing protein [Oceanirhabdus seepicola]|uniref:Glucosaminidase domain-containing protein n=1 Tax=Oceanirhabdus seepicola TaxID=2828781 RepID=A0A9J6P4L0_9CLOT|nr:glucosaminidase domain-containing protein [Oceanirhabdus seepicola]MCM1991172.1 glucosaminidase domain-containing protein [Oceanirhabdus seepicola]
MTNKSKIISSILPFAEMLYKKYNLLPSVIIAQAILETGWLRHCKGNNVFGIKWTRTCGYDYSELQTYEWINGIKTPMLCLFRKYQNYEESLLDYAKLITTSKRYVPVVKAANYEKACNELYKCGYCTDPNYPLKLISIIEENKLYEYDPIPNKIIDKKDDSIKELQKNLNQIHIYDYENKLLIVDGIIGPRTKSSIEKLQMICDIKVNSIREDQILKITNIILLYSIYLSEIH